MHSSSEDITGIMTTLKIGYRLKRIRFGIFAGVLPLFFLAASLWSAEEEPECKKKSTIVLGTDDKRLINAVCVQEQPRIDGILNEAIWEAAEFQEDFIQREPVEGENVSERTVVGILYDADNIYFGVKCFDSEPDKIIAREMRRDADMDDDDHFSIVIDTYHDHRSAYYFTVNPNGSRRDAVLANEGRNYNSAWDGIWICKARKNDEGWFAEIAIPWKTLRFTEQDTAVWGINFSRKIRRKNEDALWQLVPRNLGMFGLFRISEAGNMCGLTDLRMGGNLELKPYFLGGLQRDVTTSFATDRVTDAGLDAKIALTANLAMDLTINTDFAQVEADREQVNLTRFSLYFPEKREFFLEGAETFSFGRSGGRWMRHGGAGINLFYSRRIGIVEGQEARLLGGAKMIGKIGQTYVGALNMLTDEVFVEPDEEDPEDTGSMVNQTNFTVLRVRRDILKRSSIGMMFLNKETLRSTDYNRSFGVDGYFALTDYFSIATTLSGTFDPQEDDPHGFIDENLAGTLDLNYRTDLWRAEFQYMDIGSRFNPEMGYVRRIGFRYGESSLEYAPRPKESSSIRQFTYRLSGQYREDRVGNLLDSELGMSFTIRFQNSARFTVGVQREVEFIDEEWEVRDGFIIPIDTYSGYDIYLRTNTDQGRPLSVGFNLNYGSYYMGRNLRLGLDGNLTKISKLKIEADYNHNFVELPEGSFHTNTLGFRFFYYLSTELYFKAYVQWNDDKLAFEGREKVLSNLLLRWIYRPGSDLYVVYNDSRLIGPGSDEISNRTLMLKATFFWRK